MKSRTQSTGSTSWEYVSVLLALSVRRSRHDTRCVFLLVGCLLLRTTADTQRRNGFCYGKDVSLMDVLACNEHLTCTTAQTPLPAVYWPFVFAKARVHVT